MKRVLAIMALSAALGGCLTPWAYSQAKSLTGRPLSEAVAEYGPPDQPVVAGAQSYSWARSRPAGGCSLKVQTDATGRITHASVIAIGFNSCENIMRNAKEAREGR